MSLDKLHGPHARLYPTRPTPVSAIGYTVLPPTPTSTTSRVPWCVAGGAAGFTGDAPSRQQRHSNETIIPRSLAGLSFNCRPASDRFVCRR